MGIRITRRENIQLMNKRISAGDLQQYFKNFSQDEVRSLSKAINQDDADSVADLLLNNLNVHGQALSSFFEGAYDSQYIDLGAQFIEQFLREKIVEARAYLKSMNLVALERIEKDLDFEFPAGLRNPANSLKSQIKNAIATLNVPERLRPEAEKLAKDRKFRLTSEYYSRVVEWKDGRVVLEIRRLDNNQWKSYKILNKGESRQLTPRKSEIPKVQFKEPIKVPQKTVQALRSDMHGKPLNYREKLFLNNRAQEDFDRIWIDYNQAFGEHIRTKDELKRLFSKRK